MDDHDKDRDKCSFYDSVWFEAAKTATTIMPWSQSTTISTAPADNASKVVDLDAYRAKKEKRRGVRKH